MPWPLTIGSHSWSRNQLQYPCLIDHTSFLCAIFISISSCTVTALSSVAPRSQGLGFACGGPDGLGASLHDRPWWALRVGFSCCPRPSTPRCAVGVYRRLYAADGQHEGAPGAAGASGALSPGASLDAEAGRSHGPEPQPAVAWCAGHNGSAVALRTLWMACARGTCLGLREQARDGCHHTEGPQGRFVDQRHAPCGRALKHAYADLSLVPQFQTLCTRRRGRRQQTQLAFVLPAGPSQGRLLQVSRQAQGGLRTIAYVEEQARGPRSARPPRWPRRCEGSSRCRRCSPSSCAIRHGCMR